jgi:hypothetical protein
MVCCQRNKAHPGNKFRKAVITSPNRRNQLGTIIGYMAIEGDEAMLFPDWVAIAILVLCLVWAAAAWIRQHKS